MGNKTEEYQAGLPLARDKSMENLTHQQTKFIRPIPRFPIPPSSRMADLSLNNSSTPAQEPEPEPMLPLSLNLSIDSPASSSLGMQAPQANFQEMSGNFNSNNGDNNIISVA